MDGAIQLPAQALSGVEVAQDKSGLFSSESVLNLQKLIFAGSPLSEVLAIIAQLVESQAECMSCTIWLPDEDGKHLHCAAARLARDFSAVVLVPRSKSMLEKTAREVKGAGAEAMFFAVLISDASASTFSRWGHFRKGAHMSNRTSLEEFDLVILGGGTGGTVAAWTFATQGQRVAVIERKYVGGSCPNIACLPSKNIIHSAKVASYLR
jgi:1-aminocyclopropane-1-carboxylate deaminase/D-cysteine desulfhydrase-like pyridoxal-dependent ACC family enzyme